MNVVDNRRLAFLAAGVPLAMFVAVSPAMARKQPAAAPVHQTATAAGLPQGSAVDAFYGRWQGPDWFADQGRSVAELAAILRRAPLDGFAGGPALAALVEQAAQAVAAGKPEDKASGERVLSAAWVTYVQAIRQPTRGMIYGYAALAPQPGQADQILAAAAAAPSLAQHLAEVSAINPVYADLRDAAWRGMQSAPGAAPDPRILINLERLRSLRATNRFALVDAATQRLTMYENGKPVDSMKVVVGMRQYPTPMISSVIYYATFNPYWNVPEHLVRKTVAPNVLRQGMAYLRTRGYQVMSDWSENASVVPADGIDWKAVAAGQVQIRVRQLPGPQNSMGQLKFSFANGEDIYLHDTPSKDLFAKPERALSNGCIRLEDARRFGHWLLGRPPVAPSAQPEQFVQLPQGVPVYVTYLTAQAVGGKIAYLTDIYGRDSGGMVQASALSAPPPLAGSVSAN